MKCEDAQQLITGLIDNELSAEERRLIEIHLRDCHTCRFIHHEEAALKEELRAATVTVTAPPELWKRVRGSRPMEVGAAHRSWKNVGWEMPTLRPALALALLLILVLPLFHSWWPAERISIAALGTHERILTGKMALMRAESPQEITHKLVRSVRGEVTPMGYDLEVMKLRPVGGAVEKIGKRNILVTVYEGEGPTITCFTFLGTEEDAPQDAESFFDPEKKIRFFTYSKDGVHAVLHREGKIICILVSSMPMAELLAIARMKAKHA
ncbi:MAG TPA: anti-sigma factor [Candidatus Binatia bacterium]|nr:anti-sigma factor [Candidatus Binatia bacterium]